MYKILQAAKIIGTGAGVLISAFSEATVSIRVKFRFLITWVVTNPSIPSMPNVKKKIFKMRIVKNQTLFWLNNGFIHWLELSNTSYWCNFGSVNPMIISFIWIFMSSSLNTMIISLIWIFNSSYNSLYLIVLLPFCIKTSKIKIINELFNISNYLFIRNIFNSRNVYTVALISLVVLIFAVITDNFTLVNYLLLLVFLRFVLVLPKSMSEILAIQALNRVLGLFSLTMVITFFICLIMDLNISLQESFNSACLFVGVWCLFSMIVSLLSNEISFNYLKRLFIVLIFLMFFSMLAGIIISNIVLFTASCLDSNIVTMNSITQGSGSSQNDPAGGSGLGNSGGGLNLTPIFPKPNCHVCDAISKLHDRLDAKAFDKQNILTKKGASHDLTDLQAKALCEAMNSHVGTADHAIIK